MGLVGETTTPLFDWTTSFHKEATSVPNWSKAFATPPLWTELCPLWIELCNFPTELHLSPIELRHSPTWTTPLPYWTTPLSGWTTPHPDWNPNLPGWSKTLSWPNYIRHFPTELRHSQFLPHNLSPFSLLRSLVGHEQRVLNDLQRSRLSRGLMILLLPQPLTLSRHRRHTGRLKKERQLADGIGGEGWGRSQIIRPQESLVLYISFNTLWSYSLKTANAERKQTESLLLISSVQYGTLPAFSCQSVFAKIAQLKYICQIGRFFVLSLFPAFPSSLLGAEWRPELSKCLLYLIQYNILLKCFCQKLYDFLIL
jgi:hypothetical protein